MEISDRIKISDRVYGPVDVSEEILLRLICTSELQRLRGIHQFGMPSELYNFPNYTRFEHSLGVMFLLKRLNARLEEQVAGLLHDVSHSAFSHLIDWIYGTETQESHQDEIFPDFFEKTKLSDILKDYDFSSKRISKHENFPLLEQPSPNLCADRLDYTLREMALYQDPQNVALVRDALTVFENRILFSHREAAQIFAHDYLYMQLNHWAGLENMTRWRLLAEALKLALAQNLLTHSDFFTKNESNLIARLDTSSHPQIQETLQLLRRRPSFRVIIDPKNPQYHLKKKFRYVDPQFLDQGRVYRLTEIDPDYRAEIEIQRDINKAGWKVRIE